MDPAARKKLKAQLLDDVHAWNGSDQRGFRDIVRNAVDIDPRYFVHLREAFAADHPTVRAWGAGNIVPSDFERYAIVETIREKLEADLA